MTKPNQTKSSDAPTFNEPTRFVVVRDGQRVSDRDYSSESDPLAISELTFWKSVANWKLSDGTKVAIVPFDKKKHRIW